MYGPRSELVAAITFLRVGLRLSRCASTTAPMALSCGVSTACMCARRRDGKGGAFLQMDFGSNFFFVLELKFESGLFKRYLQVERAPPSLHPPQSGYLLPALPLSAFFFSCFFFDDPGLLALPDAWCTERAGFKSGMSMALCCCERGRDVIVQ